MAAAMCMLLACTRLWDAHQKVLSVELYGTRLLSEVELTGRVHCGKCCDLLHALPVQPVHWKLPVMVVKQQA